MRFEIKTTSELISVAQAWLGFSMLTARKNTQVTFFDPQAMTPTQLKSILLKS